MNTETWLLEHVDDAPPRLVETMVEAVRAAGGESIPDHLTEAAFTLFQRVVDGSGSRDDALPLLAADALLTHAFEAQADLDPQGLEVFTNRLVSADRLATLRS